MNIYQALPNTKIIVECMHLIHDKNTTNLLLELLH